MKSGKFHVNEMITQALGLISEASVDTCVARINAIQTDIDRAKARLAQLCPECDPCRCSLDECIDLLESDVLSEIPSHRQNNITDEMKKRLQSFIDCQLPPLSAVEGARGGAEAGDGETFEKTSPFEMRQHAGTGKIDPALWKDLSIPSLKQRLCNWDGHEAFVLDVSPYETIILVKHLKNIANASNLCGIAFTWRVIRSVNGNSITIWCIESNNQRYSSL